MAAKNSNFLDIDSNLIENSFKFEECKPAGLDGYKALLGLDEDGKSPWILVTPKPGFCVKTVDAEGKKVFVNICTLDEVPEPKDIDAETLLRLIEAQDASEYRVPLSLQDPRDQLDKSGKPAICYDVAINPKFLIKVQSNPAFKIFMLQITFDGLKDKFDVDLNIEDYVILNRTKCMGTLVPHRIRTSTTPEPKKVPKQLVEEIVTKPSYKTSVINKAKDNFTSFDYRLVQIQRGEGSYIYGEIYLPEVVVTKDVRLEIGKDRIVAENRRTGKVFDAYLPLKLASNNAKSEFSITTKTLHFLSPIATT